MIVGHSVEGRPLEAVRVGPEGPVHLLLFGAIPDEGRVARDGRFITGGGVIAGVDFAFTVLEEIAGRDVAEMIQLGLEYAPQPPFRAGTPQEALEPILAAARQRLAGSRAAREKLLAAL